MEKYGQDQQDQQEQKPYVDDFVVRCTWNSLWTKRNIALIEHAGMLHISLPIITFTDFKGAQNVTQTSLGNYKHFYKF